MSMFGLWSRWRNHHRYAGAVLARDDQPRVRIVLAPITDHALGDLLGLGRTPARAADLPRGCCTPLLRWRWLIDWSGGVGVEGPVRLKKPRANGTYVKQLTLEESAKEL